METLHLHNLDEGEKTHTADEPSVATSHHPETHAQGRVISMKQVQLTKFNIPLTMGARTTTVKRNWEKAGITALWNESSWAKSLANKSKRANLTDFDKFKLMKLKQRRRILLNREMKRLS